MKAYVCREFGPVESHKVEEIEDPRAEAGQVVVDVKAAGVSFPDVLIVQGKYQFQPPFPFSPGGEIAGVISEVGEGVVDWKVGDRVIAMTGNGGIAEKVVAFEMTLMPLPETMDFKDGAAFPLNYGTTYHALKQRGQLQPGETLLVTGAGGGVGTTAIEIGKAMGAKVIAAASTEEKLEIAKNLGADETINYSDGELKEKVKALTDGLGADVIYDPIGGDIFLQCMRCVNWKGRVLVIGFASGPIPEVPTNLALLKGCSIVGVFWGRFTGAEPEENSKNFDELFALHAEGKLKPQITKSYSLDDAAEAISSLENRKATGKVVIEI
ncbi:NADPH:quinone oxidoreductase family protein [SAR86 cluster bacterium]|jgi:NADPH2:quinone reductase|nr:NADPH:quinone oxidoreductase family protein [SAR86 cluster bacterium]MDC3150989.1 NADPH:quinone oxidoreductase family protein [SAR86 cluster bacterium]|tara:strand:- start:607 stop:1581 length:975 start_codon:yes stop_codon:yes gene_type:complete